MTHAQIAQCPPRFFALLIGEVLDKQYAIEVIDLVLKHPTGKIIEFEIELVAVQVKALHMDFRWSNDLPMQTRHRQAALNELGLSPALNDGWVDDDAGVIIVVEHEETLLHPNLRGGQTNPGSVVHRDEHVVDELDERAVDTVDVGRPLLEDGITNDADDMRSHNPRVASRRVRPILPLLLPGSAGLFPPSTGRVIAARL